MGGLRSLGYLLGVLIARGSCYLGSKLPGPLFFVNPPILHFSLVGLQECFSEGLRAILAWCGPCGGLVVPDSESAFIPRLLDRLLEGGGGVHGGVGA